jgi:hypothetical protein
MMIARRKFLLAVIGASFATDEAYAQLPYCQIPPVPVACFAACKNNTILETKCDPAANQCRSSCDVYTPGQAPAQVLDGLTSRSPHIQEGSLEPIRPGELKEAMDRASGALVDFLTAAKSRVETPGFYWALFYLPFKEPPKFLTTMRAETSPPSLKPPEISIGFTVTAADIEVLQTGDIAKMVSDAENAVFRAHFG